PGPAAMRYPKANLEKVERGVAPLELGQAEIFEWGPDGALIAYGNLFANCVKAAELLRKEGLEMAVINARFVKPLDKQTLLRPSVTPARHSSAPRRGGRLAARRGGGGGLLGGGLRRRPLGPRHPGGSAPPPHHSPWTPGPLHRTRRALRAAPRPRPGSERHL